MEKIAEDVWLFSGFPTYYLNVYLLGDVLVDAATRWDTHRILQQLKGRSLSMVVLTHCHPDHQGAAKAVCDTFHVPLACHRADVPAAEGREPMFPQSWLIRLGAWVMAGPACTVRRVLDDGDEVAGFRVIHAPGHTPGHCMFFRESDQLCIAGDVLANLNFLTGEPGLREPPSFFSVDVTQNRRSIQTLIDLQPKVVCFGHGHPLRNPNLLKRFMQNDAEKTGR